MYQEIKANSASMLVDMEKKHKKEEIERNNSQYNWPVFNKLSEHIDISHKNYNAVIEQNKILEKMYNDAALENKKLDKYNKKMSIMSIISLVIAGISLLFTIFYSIVC